MTYIHWRDRLTENLYDLPAYERNRIIFEYADQYAKLRNDGFTEEEAVEKLGKPEKAASRAAKIHDRAKEGVGYAYNDCGQNVGNAEAYSAPFAVRMIFRLGAVAALIGIIVAIIWLACAPVGLLVGGFWTIIGTLIADAAGIPWNSVAIAMTVGGCMAAAGVILIPVSILLIKALVKAFKSLGSWLSEY